MTALLPLVILCPLAVSIILLLSRGAMPARATCGLVALGMGLCAAIAVTEAVTFLTGPASTGALHVVLWNWMHVGGFGAQFALTLDRLSLVMMLVVSVVGFLILLYACAYMIDDPDIARFFTYMTLFVASMELLVLSSDLLGVYVGWEGVGVCSYLLVGFWYHERPNALAARKAFVVTRIGDALFLVGLLLLATGVGRLDIGSVLAIAPMAPRPAIALGCFLILGGAAAKSAMVPLQTWLPDAMAGPTPVSALIHAATMVTAGVYLIARLHAMFLLVPGIMFLCAVIGFITLLLAAGAAMVQTDIKRVLAYSTMSQLGYMYLALGCGAWQAAIFHLVTHAIFKALLFMGAGSIILRVHHEQDIFRMGGLRKSMPVVFYAFLAGAAALAGLPLISAGYFSKEMILTSAYNVAPLFWLGGVFGAFLTSIYIFRCVFITFWGHERTHPHGRTTIVEFVPLVILAVLAIVAGWVQTPEVIAPMHLFSTLLAPVFGPLPEEHGGGMLLLIGSIVPIIGVSIAWALYKPRHKAPVPLETPWTRTLRADWGFDALYDVLFVKPYFALARLNRGDAVIGFFGAVAWVTRTGGAMFAHMQSGQVRRYAGWIAAGTVLALCLAV
ncbi:NADH-quinone oxidoreductase subunit L [Acidomonas methanolica]|uniref:NADH-quinone oxidoreductase subunit L n=1 Tax=Acidomonas methanolica NBRC 104435 TaxID=1231351 RepID=A0A023D2W8_ACIMT|nr:NADH-quinone oxidoreductase subunit L [Acidomonas methanolica]MBU2655017.1 NADH-quinone oxidoreductase subunit L [Acidomonas methanolica]TCS25668.1 NADH dehydrogenase subunit L [Acidomonas methanolica]GAJ28477.1 NADH-quinone oxidoreductase subunit L [Acidomonas methanolica NBRC 104435]GBQ45228.1 NADH-quinone oxidoreductase chain L [Acidomonas methanolica]GEK99479.1 NADH-quinone oxidoreductase subunit L [Acidomonas methanolica NBRC 104435]